MSEDGVRAAIQDGRAALVRRGAAQTWVPVHETPFAGGATVVARQRIADLSPKEARELISSAVASGVLRAGLLLWLLGVLLFVAVRVFVLP